MADWVANGNAPQPMTNLPVNLDPTSRKERIWTIAWIRETTNKCSWELRNDFAGFVIVDDYRAWEFANDILRLPVPQNISKRLIYFCDASIRCLCACRRNCLALASSEWEGKGVFYPLSVDNSATVERLAIACTFELTISDIDGEKSTVEERLRADKNLLQQHLSLTRSHLHGKTEDVFVFTDDTNALRRVGGCLPYDPDGDMASHLEAISRHSETLD
ncbi:hypothetical protein VN97_g11955 [Penicillium thymicola]|uniref:Uncharacterized protein n=1 Tax=Penicillium thymicola TaxID=293382 RepID=A0AAI9T6U9_PENTH|nr:hypothetical protein VN97_g11955 [Penicillium thymicola]